MAKKFTVAPPEVSDIGADIITEHYPELAEAGVTIEYHFATSDSGPALKLHAWPCKAIVKIIGLQDRVAGRADAQITIDSAVWEEMEDRPRRALLHHEIHHLLTSKEDDGAFKTDSHGRPKLKMRPHDVEVGWFAHIAELYKEDSPEVEGARLLMENWQQTFFPWMLTLDGGEAPAEPAADAPAAKASGRRGRKSPAAAATGEPDNVVAGPGATETAAAS